MTLDDGIDGLIAVNVKVLSAAEIERLIHADVDAFGTEALGKRGKHMVNKLIGALVICQKNVTEIDGELAPTNSGGQVRQGLNTGNDLNAHRGTQIVNFFKFSLGVTASHIAKVGLTVHLVGVLGVKEYAIVSHFFEQREEATQAVKAHNRVARHINHYAKGFVVFHFYSFSFMFGLRGISSLYSYGRGEQIILDIPNKLVAAALKLAQNAVDAALALVPILLGDV